MKNCIKIILAIVGLISFSGCEESTIDLEPVGAPTANDLFKDTDGALTALNAAYAPLTQLGQQQGEASFLFLLEEKSDDAFHARSSFLYETNDEDIFSSAVNSTWLSLFTAIQRANLVITKIDEVPFTESERSNGLKESILGQALFIRSLSYYWLVNMYGGVPIFVEWSENTDDAKIPRNSIIEVYDQIKSDLTEAALILPEKDKFSGSKGWEKGRATQGSAYALMAEVHLILEEWQQAVEAADMVINSGQYQLRSSESYIENFQGLDENGMESIFEIQYTDDPNGPGSFLNTWYALPGTVQGNARTGNPATNDDAGLEGGFPGSSGNGLLQEWEEGDIRKDATLSTFDVPNPLDPSKPPLWVTTKYFTGTATLQGNNSYANYVVLRYARTLLTKAEALNEISAGDPAAIEIVNNIRNRAGLDALPDNVTSDKNLLREAIWKERRLELNFEGSRYFDLLRTGRYIPVTEGIQGLPVPRDKVIQHPVTQKDWYLWPIPENELSTNPQIEQNPGY